MEPGSEIWIRQPIESVDGTWTPATLIRRVDNCLVIQRCDASEPVTEVCPTGLDEVKYVQPRSQILPVDDLTELTHLHEPAILSALDQRYGQKLIYTQTGSILIAMNPFETIPIYDELTLERFRDHYHPTKPRKLTRSGTSRLPHHAVPRTSKLLPHVYGIAARAHRDLTRHQVDQSILISGESGSGKTESSKYLMQYLAMVGSDPGHDMPEDYGRMSTGESVGDGVARKILETTPLLESFGNARTLRNDNSSRFGKFIKLHFTPQGKLTGASVQTYLLEVVRLVSPARNERNFHIFYEMLAGATKEEGERWHLGPASDFVFLSQSACVHRQDGKDDRQVFDRTLEAMENIGFSAVEREHIFHLLASVLHLGNLAFVSVEASKEQQLELSREAKVSCALAAELMIVEPLELELALRTRKIKVGNEDFELHLKIDEAKNAIQALAKAMYGRFFDWMIERVNSFISVGKVADGSTRRKISIHRPLDPKFIGILDIFGFESFEKNSFEQLCINYANETLQQQFNSFVFKQEQREYEAEHVEWKYITFPDNQDILNCIAQRNTGILALIDEEGRLPQGQDQSFTNKVYAQWASTSRLSGSQVQRASGQFVVHHYAGPVVYSSHGFLDKNKDQLQSEAMQVLRECRNQIIQHMCHDYRPWCATEQLVKQSPTRKSIHRQTVGSQFKHQLVKLLETIGKTKPHYIRCIKPNMGHLPGVLDIPLVATQLRCNGILEAVRVARAGYPVRMLHADFQFHFRALAKQHSTWNDRDLFPPLLQNKSTSSIMGSSSPGGLFALGIQKGLTKYYLQQQAFDTLERVRSEKLMTSIAVIQNLVMSYLARRKMEKFRSVLCMFQCTFRYRARKRVVKQAVVVLQRHVRGRYVRRRVTSRARLEKRQQAKSRAESEAQAINKAREDAERQFQLGKERLLGNGRKKSPPARMEHSESPEIMTLPQENVPVQNLRVPVATQRSSEIVNASAVAAPATQPTRSSMHLPRGGGGRHKPPPPASMSPGYNPADFHSGRMSRIVSLPKLARVKSNEWVNDEDRFSCHICNKRFSIFRRKHHCRACGEIICSSCSIHHKIQKSDQSAQRVCLSCVAFHDDNDDSTTSGGGLALVEEWGNDWPEPPYPENEDARLETLRQLQVPVLAREGIFNMFCDVAARTLKCPIAAVSIIEEADQILMANIGMSRDVLPRELSLDAHALCEVSGTLVVLDTTLDARFAANPMVKGAVKIRFYVGAVVYAPNGHAIGTISCYDTKPRASLESEHLAVLKNLSSLVGDKMSRNYMPMEKTELAQDVSV